MLEISNCSLARHRFNLLGGGGGGGGGVWLVGGGGGLKVWEGCHLDKLKFQKIFLHVFLKVLQVQIHR